MKEDIPVDVMAVLIVTYPRKGDYLRWCRSLVDRRLAAAVNILETNSIYRWEGDVETADEVMLVIKTDIDKAALLKETIVTEHPYKVPAVLEIRPVDVYKPYLEWVIESSKS